MGFIRDQNTPYFLDTLISKSESGPVKLPGLSRNGPLDRKMGSQSPHLTITIRTPAAIRGDSYNMELYGNAKRLTAALALITVNNFPILYYVLCSYVSLLISFMEELAGP